MKKILAISICILTVLMMASAVVATGNNNQNNNCNWYHKCGMFFGKNYDQCHEDKGIDKECKAKGYQFGIAKWEYNDYTKKYKLAEQIQGYNTSVSGSQYKAKWTSIPDAAGVISKEGTSIFTHPGGASGTIYKSTKKGISHITFCGNVKEVPEFTTIGAALALGGAGLFMYRRRRS